MLYLARCSFSLFASHNLPHITHHVFKVNHKLGSKLCLKLKPWKEMFEFELATGEKLYLYIDMNEPMSSTIREAFVDSAIDKSPIHNRKLAKLYETLFKDMASLIVFSRVKSK